MKAFQRLLLSAAMIIGCFFSGFSQGNDHVPGELLVQMKAGQDVALVSGKYIEIDGRQVRVSHKKQLSPSLNIHLLAFETGLVDEGKVLRYMQVHPKVNVAQYNHYVERRLTPNDPSFGTQWSKHNTGQSGGTPDADIDAPEAWDIETGGLTAHGDTIVVAVIDGGCDLNHEDLDFFKNYGEIPGNGIDDDNNGWIDDFDGWNAYNSNGNVPGDQHGTHVAGIIGAIGDNNKGVAGVNWNVKIMPVAGSSGNESTVVEAYSYVYDMRRIYNQTNGAKGAFVVSTNSSFGVNFGDPAQYPLWCGMYDTLGTVGILSCGATMNTAADVDQDDDIPTACPQPHMVSVTNTTRNDNKNNGAAWGATTIDIGAPGTDILSTVPNNQYSQLTGTSMATPQVAGAIALMYAAACPDLIAQYKSNPYQWALNIRDFMFNSVDTIPALTGITVTQGRLNIHKMLLEIQNFCAGGSGCFIPFGQQVTAITDSSATVSWNAVDSANTYKIFWREQGGAWDSTVVTNPTLDLANLTGCTTYEYQIQSQCDTSNSSLTSVFTFETEGCCVPPANPTLDSKTDSTASVSWTPVYAGIAYSIRYREVGAGTWTTLTSATPSLQMTGLNGCTEYEWQIETDCDTAVSGFSASQYFTTFGCGQCVEGTYCATDFDAGFEWIESVNIGTLSNNSGSDNGYGDYTGMSTNILTNQTYNVSLEPGFAFFSVSEYWKIFIDYNGDGDFADPGETAFDAGSSSQNTVTGTFTVPNNAALGVSRMRVVMRWNTGPNPCDMGRDGEVEDYCVNIDAGVGVDGNALANAVQVFPNPAVNVLHVVSLQPVDRLVVTDLLGRSVLGLPSGFNGKAALDISSLPNGVYAVTCITADGKVVKKFVKE